MKELDKTKSYYLGDLSEEQFSKINELLVNDKEAKWHSTKLCYLRDNECLYLFNSIYIGWYTSNKRKEYTSVVNALELFYTLENVQVDCRELSEEQIKEMCRVYESNGYEMWDDKDALKISTGNEFYITGEWHAKTTITYDKFMELFSKEESVLTEIMKDEYKPTFCETYKSVKPQHYSKGIDTFKRMEENCTLEERLAFAKGNIDKYTWRTKGQDKEDFVKIVKYAEWAIKQLENEQSIK